MQKPFRRDSGPAVWRGKEVKVSYLHGDYEEMAFIKYNDDEGIPTSESVPTSELYEKPIPPEKMIRRHFVDNNLEFNN